LAFNAGDDTDRAIAAAINLDVDTEYTLQARGLGHGKMALGGCAHFCVGDRADAFIALRWCDQPTAAVVRCENAVVAGKVGAGFGYSSRSTGN
jgi:hypothetical protein